ncbi:MAG: zeta toxin family protein, partial [Patescibacteria group bacterium]
MLIEKFADTTRFPSVEKPLSVFMAGSPGAGKTELSIKLVEALERPSVRIDADDIRILLPGYNGMNASLFQRAASIGVELLYDYVLTSGQDCILDGTFANYNKALLNVERSLKRGRAVVILYVYQNPKTAWQFTQARELIDGRRVPKDAFIKQFFAARENVNRVKDILKKQVFIWVINKSGVEWSELNVDSID